MASNRESPRQRMINLMYLVFIAMMALNVSSEVLDGFELVEESLLRTVKSSSQNNDRIFGDLETYYANNPEKTRVWYENAAQVKEKSDTLFNYIQDLKIRIVKNADGKDGDPENLKHPDDLNASYEVMFERGKNDASRLKNEIDEYRDFILQMVSNPAIKDIIEGNFNTQPSEKVDKKTWEEAMFDNMPMAAAVTLLTKMQNDIRYAEGEVLTDLLKSVDVTDVRVNAIEAFVIPQSQMVMRGGTYRANIGMAAVDTTQRPTIYINGQKLPDSANGTYSVAASGSGAKTFSGYVEMPQGDGSMLRRDFKSEYMVIEPSATIAPVMMNVLYAGIENEVRLGASGIASQSLTATMTNGTLTHKSGDIWVAKPSAVGTPAIITVNARTSDGRTQEMGRGEFRVRALPRPSAYLSVTDANGNQTKFDGGALAKAALTGVESLQAAIDDGLLNIRFNVLSFEMVYFDQYGNTMRERSDGPRFSAAQKERIRQMKRGRMILLNKIVTKGPDGIEQTLRSPLEITIN